MGASWLGPGGQRRQVWPFAVSLAVHALLLLAWLGRPAPPPPADGQPQRLSVLLFPARPAPPASAAPVAPRQHSRREQPAAQARPSSRHDTAAADPANTTLADTPPANTVPGAPASAAPPQPSAAEILADARREIAHLAREPGGKRAGALRPGDSAWSRFERGVADAHVERAPAPVTEAYTSPDGTTYYRTRVGNSYVCRKTGTGDPSSTWKNDREIHTNSMSTLGMGGTSGVVLCPESDRDWKRP
jgi:hypothetical protein